MRPKDCHQNSTPLSTQNKTTMRKHLLLLAASTLLWSCTSHQKPDQPEILPFQDPEAVEVGPYTIDVISPYIWHIQDYNHLNPAGETFDEKGNKSHFNNCSDLYLLTGTEQALLIDLSNAVTWDSTATQSLRQLVSERIGDLPLTITFTHNHGDHTGMFPAYQNDTTVQFALPRIDFEEIAKQYPALKDTLYDEGYDFDLGNLIVHTILVPGHTAGSMVFYVEGRDLLFTGDAVGSGHGVWIFNADGFRLYRDGVPHLLSYIRNEENGIDTTALQIYGGHYWQKDWMDTTKVCSNAPILPPLSEGEELGMSYLRDMQELVIQMEQGTAKVEPSHLNFSNLDSYFVYNQAVVVWNAKEAKRIRK